MGPAAMSPLPGGAKPLVALGALLAAAGVALSAYAAHADGAARLQSAALMALVHGAALAALGGRAHRGLGRAALLALALGTLLFAGTLLGAQLAGWSTRPAPAGGLLMIGGWLLYAIDALRSAAPQGDR